MVLLKREVIDALFESEKELQEGEVKLIIRSKVVQSKIPWVRPRLPPPFYGFEQEAWMESGWRIEPRKPIERLSHHLSPREYHRLLKEIAKTLKLVERRPGVYVLSNKEKKDLLNTIQKVVTGQGEQEEGASS